MFRPFVIFAWLLIFCTPIVGLHEAAAADEPTDFYLSQVKPILKAKCFACHGAINQEAELRLDTGSLIKQGGDSGPAIDLKDVDESLLLQRIGSGDPDERMPPEGDPLTAEQIEIFRKWIRSGGNAPENEPPQVDPSQHWSFQPMKQAAVPKLDPLLNSARKTDGENANPIDAFVGRRLSNAGLTMNPPADSVTLVRRLYLDLHGLPPTPEEIEHFAKTSALDRQVAIKNLVDQLLASPRYGERWAQHWLDLVRYADTDGYEVNTPRANAWPYRDYVIRAFNEDKPYDQFVFEQLAGDSVEEDAATGFLVAAAALLPGQIGQDEASKRLARQDALDEMIVGTSATFLGLTVGCARCHDHKFDPISQRDYYAMQAFFAGVEFGERPIRDENQEQRKAESVKLAPQIAKLKSRLRKFEPLAFTGKTIVIDDEDSTRVTSLKTNNGHGENPPGSERGHKGDVGDGSRLPNISQSRYTWWDNNSGEDVFTWNPDASGRFRLWISWGVHGSGAHTRDARFVLDLDGDLVTRSDQTEIAKVDQYYFAGVNKGESAKLPLWSGLFDAGIHEFSKTSRLVLRGGETGTAITADVLVMQKVQTGEASTSRTPKLRNPVDPAGNIELFEKVDAKYVRFTTNATSNNNRYEPCIDELQIFRADQSQHNIALEDHGTKPTSSGNYSETGIHQLKHVNDGKNGNSHSWISNEKGKGWVQLEFSKVETIDRIEWARDREGKLKDRLPVDYQIEVSLDGMEWVQVAGSEDRMPLATPIDKVQSLVRNAPKNSDVKGLADELNDLETRKSKLDQEPMVFAGKMREPDMTFVLLRGDPEQPSDEIAPRTPEMFGGNPLAENGEQQRRIELAKWIVDSENPLAARVIVNRVWQYHFGRGLVNTPSDFGLNGEKPSHPELLDWLATKFMDNGWSLKKLHHLILSSNAYQQSNATNSTALTIDADDQLLWRFPSRRLEAEAIRDSMLFVNGQLNLEMNGPGFNFFKSRGGLSGFPPVTEFKRGQLRRMIYAHKIRMEPVPVFGAFDCPDAGQPTPKRSRSTTAIQALNLFNSPFVAEQADRFAEHIKSKVGDSVERQVDLAFLKTLGRKPTESEQAATSEVAKEHGLAVICRVLFNSNEFLFIP